MKIIVLILLLVSIVTSQKQQLETYDNIKSHSLIRNGLDLDALLNEEPLRNIIHPKSSDRNSNPFEVIIPTSNDEFKMPPRIVRSRLPAIGKIHADLDQLPAEMELCSAFKTPQEKIDVGCKWYERESGSRPFCISSHTPTSIMGQVKRCDPYLARNLERRIKETLQGVANDCTWVVVNHENFARLFCDPKPKAVLVKPRDPRIIDPVACKELQKAAPNGIIDVGCLWSDGELAPRCRSRLTPKGAMFWLKKCDRNAFENVFDTAVKHVRGARTECKWSMTPSDAVLVTSTQVLLCPFVTDVTVKPPKVINQATCAKLQELIPDGKVPVGCSWDRSNPDDVPRCLSRATPNLEMKLVKKCDPTAYDNLVTRIRATMRGEKTDCNWRAVGDGEMQLFCNVLPQQVVLPAIQVPARPVQKACDALVKEGSINVGCVRLGKDIRCASEVTETKDMTQLRLCDAKTWRLVRKLVVRVVRENNPSPCTWRPISEGVDELNCPLN